MTNPVNSKHWASQVDAVTREYIDARIHEELKPMRDDIAALVLQYWQLEKAYSAIWAM